MMSLLQNKMVLMILGGVLIAGVVWYSFLRDRPGETLIETADLTQAGEADSDIVNTLLQLRAVTLSGTIFSDPAFLRLQDFGRAIVPEPVGRQNPFAPLAGQGAAAAAPRTATSSATSTATSTLPRTR